MASRNEKLSARRPKDKAAAEKLDWLMRNAGLSSEVLGAQVGVSGRRIRQIISNHDEPGRGVKYAIARRFNLLPGDIWKRDVGRLTPDDIEHLRNLAKRQEALA